MRYIKNFVSKVKMHICPSAYLRSLGAEIGEGCEIYPSANFGNEPYLIKLGNHVRVNEGVQFITHDGGVWVLRALEDELRDIDLFGKIEVGNNVHIGTNAVLMPGVTIGDSCIIGCGAVVTKSIPANSIVGGVPARIIETVEEYKEKHMDDFEHTKYMSGTDKKEFLKKKYKF